MNQTASPVLPVGVPIRVLETNPAMIPPAAATAAVSMEIGISPPGLLAVPCHQMMRGPPSPDVEALPAQILAEIELPPALTVMLVPMPAENVGHAPLTVGRLGGMVPPLVRLPLLEPMLVPLVEPLLVALALALPLFEPLDPELLPEVDPETELLPEELSEPVPLEPALAPLVELSAELPLSYPEPLLDPLPLPPRPEPAPSPVAAQAGTPPAAPSSRVRTYGDNDRPIQLTMASLRRKVGQVT